MSTDLRRGEWRKVKHEEGHCLRVRSKGDGSYGGEQGSIKGEQKTEWSEEGPSERVKGKETEIG